MTFEWRDADSVMAEICGSQIANGRIEPDGLYLTFSDQRVLVIVGLPELGIALLQPERYLH
jgi:hypothetical protein